MISGLYSKVLKKESGQQYISNELDKGHCMKVHKWEGLQNKCSTFRIIKMPGEFSTSPTKCRLYLTASRSSWLTSKIKLGGTAAKRVKGSVKHAKPAQHCCRHARGHKPWEQKQDWCGQRNRAESSVKGTAGTELGMIKQPEQKQDGGKVASRSTCLHPSGGRCHVRRRSGLSGISKIQ